MFSLERVAVDDKRGGRIRGVPYARDLKNVTNAKCVPERAFWAVSGAHISEMSGNGRSQSAETLTSCDTK